MKNILFGIMAGFTTGTILGVMLTSGMLTSEKSIAMRKKIVAQGETYLEAATKKFNDSLADLTKRLERKLEKQAR